MGRSPYPLFRARSLPPPQSVENVIANVLALFHMQTVSQGGRRPEPRRLLRIRRTRGLRKLDPTLGSCRDATRRVELRHSAEGFRPRVQRRLAVRHSLSA